jgi:uncharacterized protein
MSQIFHAQRLNIQAFAQEAAPLAEATPLQNMERLVHEALNPAPDTVVNWRASGELRPRAGAEEGDIWLHLSAQATLPLCCQRCMTSVETPLEVDQWFRFVADEDTAMAQDDQSVEDLLVLAPQFDLLDLLEDELLMALPLVPMHENCPVSPVFSAGEPALAVEKELKPNPFAALAGLKKQQ